MIMTNEKSKVTALGNLSAHLGNENFGDYDFRKRVSRFGLKTRESWCDTLCDNKDHEYDSISKVRLRFFGLKRWWHGWRVAHGSVAKINGNRNVAYLNRNDSKRKLNLNWQDNDWNEIYRFLAVRYYPWFSWDLFPGVLLTSCLFQPPSIFPISLSISDI